MELKLAKDKKVNMLVLILLVAAGILVIGITFTITWEMNFLDYIFWFLALPAFVAFISFMTSVKFYSPLAITENETFTTFNSRTEVVYDEEWGTSIGLVFVEGYNAAKRLLSKADIERLSPEVPGKTVLLACASPFLIESVANGRFIVVRGWSNQMNRWEAKAFLARPSVRRVLENDVRTAKVYWISASKSLHADEMPEDVSTLGDLADVLKTWHGEIARSVELFSEDFLRRLKAVKTFRESPLEKMARETAWKPRKDEKDV